MSTGGQPAPPAMTAADLMSLCAVDSDLFAKTFFPSTMRQPSPPFAREVWAALEDPTKPYVNLKMFRGSGKTTLSRLFTAKRVAYALSHTILYLGANEDHAERSISWLQSRIAQRDPHTGKLVPTAFARFFGLTPGRKWNQTELEVIHGLDKRPIWILGAGITGSVRGINFEDYRPDLIYLDDVLTDENSATKEQREKLTDLVFGAVKESLAPRADEPNAKMVLDQTPHHVGDVSQVAETDPSFYTINVPCWTPATLDLPIDYQESAWPERYPTQELREQKRNALITNRYSIFAREKEVRVVSRENAAFRAEWLRRRERPAPPMFCVLAIDPVPPPSDKQLQNALRDKDFECQMVVGRKAGEYHVLEYVTNRGHEPLWSVTTALALAARYRVARIVVESVAYQRTLKWVLQQEMSRRQMYWPVVSYGEQTNQHRMPKYARITGTLHGPAAAGRLWIAESGMESLILQFDTYPSSDHDDILDALAMGMSELSNPFLEGETPDEDMDSDETRPLEFAGVP